MTKRCTILTLVVVVGVILPAVGSAGLEDEIELLRREVYNLRREIADVKDLLRQVLAAQGARVPSPPTPKTAMMVVAGHPAMGRADAPVTVVEFSSYQCPFCKRHFDTVLPKIKQEYIDTGKVRYVFRDFPLKSQPDSPTAAKAVHCAGEEGRYWEMHDVLFNNQGDLSIAALKRYADSLGLNGQQFSACLESDKFTTIVEQNVADGLAVGIRGTPSFLIGPTENGPSIRGRLLVGAQSFAAFKQAIERELAEISKR